MSIEFPIKLSAAQAHEAAIDDVNRWRGHCVECFARLERGMGEALELIAGAPSMSKRLPFTFGDKVKALHLAISTAGPFANARLLKSLQDAGTLIDQRNLIVHASGKVLINASGNWSWVYRFKPLGKSEETGMYEEKAAHQLETQLAKASQSLCGQLRAFSQKLAVTK